MKTMQGVLFSQEDLQRIGNLVFNKCGRIKDQTAWLRIKNYIKELQNSESLLLEEIKNLKSEIDYIKAEIESIISTSRKKDHTKPPLYCVHSITDIPACPTITPLQKGLL